MGDLISRSAFIEYVREEFGDYGEELVGIITECPTVEAEPVVHGEWEVDNGVLFPVYRCSKCNCATALGKTKFCPNCGAKMDGKSKV